jgi:hypothetical protein
LIVKAVGSHSSAGLYSVKRHAAIVLFNWKGNSLLRHIVQNLLILM